MYRDATLEDVEKILVCIIEFWEDRNHHDYEISAVKDFLITTIKREYRYISIYEENGNILGGQISTIHKHPFSSEKYLSEEIWFTSPRSSRFKRLKIAYGVLRGINKYMKTYNLKRIVNHIHSTDGSEGCTAANKLLQKMGYQLLYKQYVKEI